MVEAKRPRRAQQLSGARNGKENPGIIPVHCIGLRSDEIHRRLYYMHNGCGEQPIDDCRN
jgi:hypothetical protein